MPWLETAKSYRVVGTERLLLAADGALLATLRPGARPSYEPGRPAPLPPLTPALRSQLAEPPPLPAGAVAPTVRQLLGRWRPLDADAGSRPYVRFERDGTWRGSDGCNGTSGLYQLGPGGRLLTTTGVSTLAACAGSEAAGQLRFARRAGLVGDDLVLYDVTGKELYRLAYPG